ncbi:hypothetical protein [Micromonospora carbonacea]|uniref:Uncharacterized protein n=1 Tax=Micromonospora carbonacea TaxID=47853 RepID=A0A1C5ABG3_9ACTN|nr:hypothetical protein [Micromonospora carbonacea]SCF42364.1 hypothetical protein GA0070563_11270 [Micromonospora carbonacea]
MATRIPTKSQAYLIAHFADRPFPEKARANQTTYKKCRDNGWLEATDTWPYHQTTDDGIAALNAYEQANQPARAAQHLMELIEAYGKACYLHGPNTSDAHRLHEQIRQAITRTEA